MSTGAGTFRQSTVTASKLTGDAIDAGSQSLGTASDNTTAGILNAKYQVQVIGAAPTTVAHGLGRVPVGYIPVSLTSPAAASGVASITKASASAWTTTNIYLKANVAGTSASILIF